MALGNAGYALSILFAPYLNGRSKFRTKSGFFQMERQDIYRPLRCRPGAKVEKNRIHDVHCHYLWAVARSLAVCAARDDRREGMIVSSAIASRILLPNASAF